VILDRHADFGQLNNFGVWATGELQNPEEVLTEKILESLKITSDQIRIEKFTGY